MLFNTGAYKSKTESFKKMNFPKPTIFSSLLLSIWFVSICYGQTDNLLLDTIYDYCLLEEGAALVIADFSDAQIEDIAKAIFVELKQVSEFHQGPESCFESTSTNLISFIVIQLETNNGMFFATSLKIQKNILNNRTVIHDLVYKSGPTIYTRGHIGFEGFKNQVSELARKEFETVLLEIIKNRHNYD